MGATLPSRAACSNALDRIASSWAISTNGGFGAIRCGRSRLFSVTLQLCPPFLPSDRPWHWIVSGSDPPVVSSRSRCTGRASRHERRITCRSRRLSNGNRRKTRTGKSAHLPVRRWRSHDRHCSAESGALTATDWSGSATRSGMEVSITLSARPWSSSRSAMRAPTMTFSNR